MDYLIIGGSSVAGKSAIKALREHHGQARIIATSSGDRKVDEADETIGGIDLNDLSGAVEKTATGMGDSKPAILFYTPALGPIGYPIASTPVEDARRSFAFSVAPMKAMAERLNPGLVVGYSAFYWLPHALGVYGSMAYAKIGQERLSVAQPDKYRMIRAGTFRSKATRGIALLLQRLLRSTEHASLKQMEAEWKESGRKFSDFFFDYAFASEKRVYEERFDTPHKATDEAGLKDAVTRILKGEGAPIVNVIGDWIWTETEFPELPDDFKLLNAEGEPWTNTN